MPALGFPAKPESQTFFRDTPYGWDAFHISFIRHMDDFDVTADVAVRIDALEELVNDGDRAQKSRRDQTASIGAELGNIAQGVPLRWTVASPENVSEVARAIAEAFVQIGLPYIERYSDPNVMLDALAPNDRSAWLHSPFHSPRCKREVGLAILTGRRAELASLTERCREFLSARNDPGLASFEEFVSRL
jgi:hypothetical protein